ncbi:carboxylating nicotinate-nucleotide diphosphorylase [Schleiferia thermophila]|jgi:nicotinate-nucleotide pyrophosphorylase (carboxylating)|uniref:carboxylating nicotinate-nucleotide diphosphorylase n=1 Tax=Schleiferia thermophila TaxID=884107 RepID=UPI0004E618C0|nr:carboxylating nicotinate-nucleotide diphosphorylase [Schleiferia thermophila]KFD40188.1 nicotinate-nucleotide pyrophosphorylase [Schleiferia thermophila str. Yellowstone]PMB37871.1 nicotinate-nucleotide diphosphorylase (carboxylating) [Fischerella thermalis CCMEE 5319]
MKVEFNKVDFDSQLDRLIELSLQEDLGHGDHSSLACIPKNKIFVNQLLIKEDCVFAGEDVISAVFRKLDPGAVFVAFKQDGEKCSPGEVVYEVEANAHALLAGERLMLNLVQRMCGIATYTSKLVSMIRHTNCKLLDTRKTTPLLRFLEKKAVVIGGGYNHRFGLYDMIMLKDNHIDIAGSITKAVQATRAYLMKNNLDLKIEVECRNFAEVEEAIQLQSVDRIMFDNFTPEMIVKALEIVKGSAETEASGGITEDNLKAYAETGVDYISIGALTHSVKAIDISFKAKK